MNSVLYQLIFVLIVLFILAVCYGLWQAIKGAQQLYERVVSRQSKKE